MTTPRLPLVGALLWALTTTTQAHQVWLEQQAGQVRLHFGEFNENLRETSPGALDKFTGVPPLQVLTGGQLKQVDGQRGANAFQYTLSGSADTLLAQPVYPLIDRSQRKQPALLWQPAARWVASLRQPVAPTAALDLVPTGQPGQFKVSFQGQPLPKAKVQMAAPSGWTREAETGADGLVTFPLPWQGQYVAEVKHSDKSAGQAQGSPYGEASHLMTLSFVLSEGMPSPALPAPATPTAQ